jgi:hypothetical protein
VIKQVKPLKERFPNLKEEELDFISLCLVTNPDQRKSVAQLL